MARFIEPVTLRGEHATLEPLARAHVTRAAALFRDLVAPEGEVTPPRPYMAAMLVAGAGLAGLAIATAIDRELAAGFVAGALASILVFRLLAAAVQEAGRRIGRPRRPALRLAVANLIRPGSPAPQVVLSLGLGLTVLVAIAVVQSNLSDQVNRQIPDQAPSYFFVDVQSSDIEAFNRLVTDHPGTSGLEEVPSLRGRIVAINGDPAEERLVDPNRAWLINGDRGVTSGVSGQADEDDAGRDVGEFLGPGESSPRLGLGGGVFDQERAVVALAGVVPRLL